MVRTEPTEAIGGDLQVTTQKKLVLIAEPSQVLGNLIQFNLNRFGFNTILVHRGDEAFCRIASNPFDVLISNFHLPGIDGIHLCSRIRLDLHQTAIRMVLMVEKSLANDFNRLVTPLDLTAIVSKPFSIQDLAFSLDSGSKRQLRAS